MVIIDVPRNQRRQLARRIVKQEADGVAGLSAHVIKQAYKDALTAGPVTRLDALEYFDSDYYREHVIELGLPEDFLPVGLRRVL